MTAIEFDGGIVVEALDARNWTVRVRSVPSVPKARREEMEQVLGYFPTIDPALSKALDHRLRVADAQDIETLRREIERFRRELSQLGEIVVG